MRHIPNILTSLRILLALLYPFAPAGWRLAIVALALLTEYLDGALSRAFNTTSRLGQLLDPIADKLFFAAVAFTFIREGNITVLEFALLGLRDLSVLAVVLWTLARGRYALMRKMKPLILGKIVTVFQYFVCFDVLLAGSLNRALFYATAALSFAAAAQYADAFRKSTAVR
jgi:cardiolipin synthase